MPSIASLRIIIVSTAITVGFLAAACELTVSAVAEPWLIRRGLR